MEAEIKRWEEPGFAGLIPDQGHAAGMIKTGRRPLENDHGTAWNARGCWDFERRLGRGEGRPGVWRENDWGRAEGAEIGLRTHWSGCFPPFLADWSGLVRVLIRHTAEGAESGRQTLKDCVLMLSTGLS